MPICSIDLPNEQKLRTRVLDRLDKSSNYVYGNKFWLNFPRVTPVSSPVWSGDLSLYLPWKAKNDSIIRQAQAASVSFDTFTNNCGIRAIKGNRVMYDEVGAIWFEILEAYAFYLGYSVLVGSTGQQNGSHQLGYIKQYGVDWEVVSPGLNRRIEHMTDNLFLYWKYLKKPKIQIDWREMADAEQITYT